MTAPTAARHLTLTASVCVHETTNEALKNAHVNQVAHLVARV